MTSPPDRIPLPAPPAPPQPYSFPLIATIAPVVVSLAMWAVTQSVFALVFAALGPAVAIASLADARIHTRRRSRREAARFAGELASTRAAVAAAHDRERELLTMTMPSARRLLSGGWPAAELWRASVSEPVPVGLGIGPRASAVTVDGAPPGTALAEAASLGRLRADAAILARAPVVVDARHGIGVYGPAPVAAAAARALVVQLAAALSPRTHVIVAECPQPVAEWRWLQQLPHQVTASTGGDRLQLRFRDTTTGHDVAIAAAPTRDQLPGSVRIVLAADAATAELVHHPDPTLVGELRSDMITRVEASAWARSISGLARRDGLVEAVPALPAVVRFADCGAAAEQARQGSLDCATAVRAGDGAVLRLDLVHQGPHAVVGGTTGSGKSELLTAWVLAMAATYPPRALSVLLIDFKGGSAFAPLEALPHCVGVITDLDEATASRALDSLAAELRRRERHLAAAPAKSIDGLGEHERLPRLVIVVDEFAAMVAGFPELHALFSDIAARGRSLGVHLILCTQRPAGVIRDAVLANSALRISLRVNNRGDSAAVIGTDAAAKLPASPRGRALVVADGGDCVAAQFPLVGAADVAAVAAAWRGERNRQHRPWLDELPARVPLAGLPRGGPGIPFGRLDDPAEQRQPVARYDPPRHGNLLVLGGAGSGKSTLLATLAAAAEDERVPVQVVPAGAAAAWDALENLAAEIRDPGRAPAPRLVLLDDLDVLVSRLPEEYDSAVLDRLAVALREGPPTGVRLVITAQRLTPGLHAVAGLCASRLLLALPSRQEHLLGGGDPVLFRTRAAPGAGTWEGLRLQVAVTAPENRAAVPPATSPVVAALEIDPARPLAVVSTSPGGFADRLRRADGRFARPGAITELGAHGAAPPGVVVSSGTHPSALIGDPDAWQAHWGALAGLRSTHAVIVDGCSASEFRAITRQRPLPPPLAGAGAAFWLLLPDGSVVRRRFADGSRADGS